MSAGLAALLSSTSEERADHLEVAECARRHVFAIVGPRRFSLPRSSPNQHDISVRCFKALAPTRHFTNLQTDVWHSNEFAMSRTVAVRRHWQKHLECTQPPARVPVFHGNELMWTTLTPAVWWAHSRPPSSPLVRLQLNSNPRSTQSPDDNRRRDANQKLRSRPRDTSQEPPRGTGRKPTWRSKVPPLV